MRSSPICSQGCQSLQHDEIMSGGFSLGMMRERGTYSNFVSLLKSSGMVDDKLFPERARLLRRTTTVEQLGPEDNLDTSARV
jgi:hypothetical protein